MQSVLPQMFGPTQSEPILQYSTLNLGVNTRYTSIIRYSCLADIYSEKIILNEGTKRHEGVFKE